MTKYKRRALFLRVKRKQKRSVFALRLPFVIYFAIDLSYNFLAFDRRCKRNSSTCRFGNIRKIDKRNS
jgi:hypothetical protein